MTTTLRNVVVYDKRNNHEQMRQTNMQETNFSFQALMNCIRAPPCFAGNRRTLEVAPISIPGDHS